MEQYAEVCKASQYTVNQIRKCMSGPPLPIAARHLMDWFRRLNLTRNYDGSSGAPMALDPQSIRAWADQMGIQMAPRDFEIITALDSSYRGIVASEAEPTQPESAVQMVEFVKAAKMASMFNNG